MVWASQKQKESIMVISKVKAITTFTGKGIKGMVIMGSFLLLAWIAYCVSLLTSDLLNVNANEHKKDVEIILLKC